MMLDHHFDNRCMKLAVQVPQRRLDLGVVRLLQSCEHNSIKAHPPLVDGLVSQHALGHAGRLVGHRQLAPRLQRAVIHLLDRVDKHGLLVLPEAIQFVLAELASSGQFGGRGAAKTELDERLGQNRQQPHTALFLSFLRDHAPTVSGYLQIVKALPFPEKQHFFCRVGRRRPGNDRFPLP